MSDSQSKLMMWLSDLFVVGLLAIAIGVIVGIVGGWLGLGGLPIALVCGCVAGLVGVTVLNRRRSRDRR